MAKTPVNAPDGSQIWIEHEEFHTPEQIIAAARKKYYGTGFSGKVADYIRSVPEALYTGVLSTLSGGSHLIGSTVLAGEELHKQGKSGIEVQYAAMAGNPALYELRKKREEAAAIESYVPEDDNRPMASESDMVMLGDALIEVSQDYRDLKNKVMRESRISPTTRDDLLFEVSSSVIQSMPLMLATGGASAFAQMADEQLSDSERTLGKKFVDMTDEEKRSVSAATGLNAILGGSLEYIGGRRLGLTPKRLKEFLSGKVKLPNGVIKESIRGFVSEGLTETSQGQVRDTLARYFYDDDRKLIGWDVAKNRFHEFIVGGLAGAAVSGGLAGLQKVMGTVEPDTSGDTGGEAPGGGPRLIDYKVEYVDTNGNTQTVVVSSESTESAREIFKNLREGDESIDPNEPIVVSELAGEEKQSDQDEGDDGDGGADVVDPTSTESVNGVDLDPIFDREGQLVGWKPAGTETPANLTQLELPLAETQEQVPGQGVPQSGVQQPAVPKRNKPKIGPARSQGRAARKKAQPAQPAYVLPSVASKMAPKWYGQPIEFDSDLTRAIYGSRGAKTSKAIMKSLKDYGLSEGKVADLKRQLNADARAQAKKGGSIRLSLPSGATQGEIKTEEAKATFNKNAPHTLGEVYAEIKRQVSTLGQEEKAIFNRISSTYGVISDQNFQGKRLKTKDFAVLGETMRERVEALQAMSNSPIIGNQIKVSSTGLTFTVEGKLPSSIYPDDIWSADKTQAAEEAGARTIPLTQDEIRMRGNLPVSKYGSLNDLKSIIESGTWGTLTGENPGDERPGPEVNKKLNARAMEWLKARGYDPIPIFGNYDGAENSFLVEGLTPRDAVEFAKEFRQTSVATDRGLIYQDGSMEPRAGINTYAASDNTSAIADNYYSTIKIGDSLYDFQVNYDYNNKVRAPGIVSDGTATEVAHPAMELDNVASVPISSLEGLEEIDRLRAGAGLGAQSINEIAESIKTEGIKEPILVTYDPSNGLAQVTDGNTRLAAAKIAGIQSIPIRLQRSFAYFSDDRLESIRERKSQNDAFNLPKQIAEPGTEVGQGFNRYASDGLKYLLTGETAEPVGARSLMSPDQVIETADERIYSVTGKNRYKQRVETDPGEGGKVRTIAKLLRIPQKEVIGWNNLRENVIQKAADRMVKVMEKASNLFPNFESWYVGRINMAMDIYSELDPRLKNDEDSFLFKVILAITSNGNEVEAQATDTYKIYQRFKDTGTFKGSRPSGNRTSEIKEHLMLFEGLVKAHGWRKVKKFFDTEGSVSELRNGLISEFGFNKEDATELTKGELIDEVVPFSLIFGPKLGSFYNNLNGKLDTTTMDRWFMRTFGRTMGTQLLKVAKEDVQAAYDRYNNAIDNLPEDSFLKQRNLNIRKNPTSNNLKAITKHFEDKANREGMGKGEPLFFSPENEFRKAANNLIKKMDGLQILESPRGGMHRRFIRRVMDRALKDYNKSNGTNFSPAEIQALLWYYEKEVHDAFGSKQTDKAPDYATAANTLFRKINGRDSDRFTPSNLIGGAGGGFTSSDGGRGGAIGGSEGGTGITGSGTGVQGMAEPAGAAPGNRAFNEPLPDATSISLQYSEESGITFNEPTKIRSVNEERAKRIADAFERMQDNPTDPEVFEAYQAMAEETIAQYKTIIANGYRVDANNKEYNNSNEMIQDLRNRKIMNIFSTEEGFGDEPITEKQRAENPLLQDSGFKDISGRTLLVNDVFRFVHDFFGHAKLGNGFGAIGEENAWNVHSRMYTMKARRAMTTETRGQNSWVNFSGVNEVSFSYRDTARQLRREGKPQEAKKYSDKAYETFRFADQKINLLPNEFILTDEEIAAGKTEADVVGSTPSASTSPGDSRNRVTQAIKKMRRVIQGLKVNVKVGDTGRSNPAIYDPNSRTIIIDPARIENLGDDALEAVVREEMIHAAKHRVAMDMNPKLSPAAAWNKVMGDLGKALTAEQRRMIEDMYGQELSETNAGAEYFRAAIQELLYGRTTEQTLFQGKAGEIMARIVKRIQQYVSRALGKDIKENPDAARLIVDTADMLMRLDPDARPTNQKVIEEARKLLDKGPGAEAALDVITPTDITTDIMGDDRKSKKVRNTVDKSAFTLLSIFKKIHPALQGPVNRWANQIKIRTSENQDRVRNFAKKIHKLPMSEAGMRLRQVLTYSPITDDNQSERSRQVDAERTELLRRFGLLNEYQVNVRPVLDKLYQEAAAAGIEVDYIENYFPRVVKDIKGLRESMSKDEINTFDAILRAENQRRREANEPEIESRSAEAGGLLHDFLMGKLYGPSGEIQPGFIQMREIDMIPLDKLKYYATPAEALMFRIKETIAEIENTKTFGRLRKDGKREQVGEFYRALAPLVEAGNVTTEALDIVPGLVKTMLMKTKAEHALLQASRTIAYLQLINPTSVLSQVYEFALTLNKDPGSAIRAVFDTISGIDQKELSKIGINPVSDEFFYGGGTEAGAIKFLNKSLETGLKAIGFAGTDIMMKRVNLRADYLRLRKEAENLKRNPDSYRAKKFKRQLQDQMYVRWQETYADLLSGKRNSPYVRDMLLTEMRKTQPLTDLEKTYLEQKNPNYRSLYTLKRFMITQLTYVRENTYDVLRDPNASARDKAEAVKFMLSLTAFMMMVGMPIDALKDWIAGRAGYVDDYMWNSALRIFGMSKYNLYQARTQGLARALIDAYILPVGAQQAIDLSVQMQMVAQSENQEDLLNNLANVKALNATPLDDFWYYRWGKGAETQEYKRKQRIKEDGVFPFIEPAPRR